MTAERVDSAKAGASLIDEVFTAFIDADVKRIKMANLLLLPSLEIPVGSKMRHFFVLGVRRVALRDVFWRSNAENLRKISVQALQDKDKIKHGQTLDASIKVFPQDCCRPIEREVDIPVKSAF